MSSFLKGVGLILALTGLVASLRGDGWRFMYVSSRRQGVWVLAAGLLLWTAGHFWPAPAPTATAPPPLPESPQAHSAAIMFDNLEIPARAIRDLAVGVLSWEVRPQLGSTPARGQFVLLELVVFNGQSESASFSGGSQTRLRAPAGSYWSPSTPALVALQTLGLEHLHTVRGIEPGQVRTGWVAFDVPADLNSADLLLEIQGPNVGESAILPLSATRP